MHLKIFMRKLAIVFLKSWREIIQIIDYKVPPYKFDSCPDGLQNSTNLAVLPSKNVLHDKKFSGEADPVEKH